MATCEHFKTRIYRDACNTDIEECLCCGMSRSVWEQGMSDWKMVDLDDYFEETKQFMEDLENTLKEL